MPLPLTLAIIVNLIVLLPVTFGLITDKPWATEAYGPDTAARGILVSVYLAILLASLLILLVPNPEPMTIIAATLMGVQILYKCLTLYFVGLGNPVVVTNAIIVVFHASMLAITFR